MVSSEDRCDVMNVTAGYAQLLPVIRCLASEM